MNKQRRSELQIARDMINGAYRIIRKVLDAEQDAFDNTPENLQNSERYSQAEISIDSLEDLMSILDEADETLQFVIEH
jgi:hypothetical protein